MRIIDAIVNEARRCRDFGRVEARVTLTYEPYPGAPAMTRTLLTSVAPHDPKGRDLRTRLIADAVLLARVSVPASAPLAEAA